MSVLYTSFGAVAGRSRNRVGRGGNALTGHTQARFGVDRLMAHEAHEPAHTLGIDGVPGQAQVVAQTPHALEVVRRKLLVE